MMYHVRPYVKKNRIYDKYYYHRFVIILKFFSSFDQYCGTGYSQSRYYHLKPSLSSLAMCSSIISTLPFFSGFLSAFLTLAQILPRLYLCDNPEYHTLFNVTDGFEHSVNHTLNFTQLATKLTPARDSFFSDPLEKFRRILDT